MPTIVLKAGPLSPVLGEPQTVRVFAPSRLPYRCSLTLGTVVGVRLRDAGINHWLKGFKVKYLLCLCVF